MRHEVNNWQYVGFFILTYETKHNVLDSLHELKNKHNKNTRFLLRNRKKVSIGTLFQKVCLGSKLSPIINRRGRGWNKNVLGEKNQKIDHLGDAYQLLKSTLQSFLLVFKNFEILVNVLLVFVLIYDCEYYYRIKI